MKVIKEGVVRTLQEKVTCKRCHAILEITPKDCIWKGSLVFWVTCPCCKKTIRYFISEVDSDFWLNIPLYNN